MISNRKLNFLLDFISLIAGAQMVLAFAPFNLAYLAFTGLGLLLITWIYTTAKRAAWRGFLFGIGFFGFGVYWIYISIYVHGNAPMLAAIFATALFILVLALFPAINGYLLNRIFQKNSLIKLVVIFPASWVLFEWLRGWILTGFPWLFIGYSQINQPLSAIAPILGIYGVSFFTAFTASTIIAIISNKNMAKQIIALLLLIIIWSGCFYLNGTKWTLTLTKPIQVSLIQGNISQELKWDLNELKHTTEIYQKLTEQNWHSNIIIWPEAAIPLFKWQTQDYINTLAAKAKKHKTTIVTGILTTNKSSHKYYNSMIAFGLNTSIYLKRHLVPFGEYPFLPSLTNWFTNYFHIPMSNFSKGPNKQPEFLANNFIIAPSICYEIAYPNEILDFLPKAQILINISDDSWFGNSTAAAQQLQIAQMRSLETGRYQLVVTNTGITAIIKPNGKIQAQAPKNIKYVLTGKIYPMQGTTPLVHLYKLFF